MNSKSDIVKVLSPLAEAMQAKKELGVPYMLSWAMAPLSPLGVAI